MQMIVYLIKAHWHEADRIFTFQEDADSRTYKPMRIEEIRLAIRDDTTLLIAYDDEFVGFMIYKAEEARVHLKEFVVQKQSRRRGIGAAALTQMLDKVPAEKCVELMTHPANPAAHLYERFGFIKISEVRDFYGDGEPGILMRRASQNR